MQPKSVTPFSLKFNLNQVFGKIYVSSILKDMIYVLAFFTVFVFLLAIFHVATWIIVLSFLILIGFLIFFGYCYNWLMHNNPDSLKSESYQLGKQQLEMMGNKNNEVPAQVIEAEPVIKKPKEKTNKKQIKAPVGKGRNKK